MIATQVTRSIAIVVTIALSALLEGCWSSESKHGSEDTATETDAGWDTNVDTLEDDDAWPDGPHDPVTDSADDTVMDPDLPDVGDDVVVAELVGPPVVLDDETDAGGLPAAGWNGDGWGIAWNDFFVRTMFRPLDAMANPIGPSVPVLDEGGVIALSWHIDRYILVGSLGWPSQDTFSVTVEEMGTVIDEPVNLIADATEPDVVWSDDAGGWIVGVRSEVGLENVSAMLLGNDASPVGIPVAVNEEPAIAGPRVVSLKTRISMVWPGYEGLWFRSFRWGEIDGSALPSLLTPGISWVGRYIEAEGFLDDTLIVGMDGYNLQAAVVEPWTGTIVSGPSIIGYSGITDRRPGLATALSRGYIGVCWETGTGPYGGSGDFQDGVAFALLAPNGTRLGADLTVASGLLNIGGCAIGWSGSEFVVIYWSCGAEDAENAILAQRVVPLI